MRHPPIGVFFRRSVTGWKQTLLMVGAASGALRSEVPHEEACQGYPHRRGLVRPAGGRGLGKLQVKPALFPPHREKTRDEGTVELHSDLPEPVYRHLLAEACVEGWLGASIFTSLVPSARRVAGTNVRQTWCARTGQGLVCGSCRREIRRPPVAPLPRRKDAHSAPSDLARPLPRPVLAANRRRSPELSPARRASFLSGVGRAAAILGGSQTPPFTLPGRHLEPSFFRRTGRQAARVVRRESRDILVEEGRE